MVKNSFLSLLAKDVIKDYGKDFSNLNIIFTNKRAKQFFNEALYLEINQPFFSPKYYTIKDFLSKNTSLIEAEEIVLIHNLYISYSEVFYKYNPKEEKETFEHFFYWGKMLLSDFDDLDKHLANAQLVFNKIENYHSLSVSAQEYLNEEQLEIISRFFENCFHFKENKIQKEFSSIWNVLFEVYTLFNERLKKQNIAYSGMIYKDVLEKIQNIDENNEKENYIIAGFNVLNTAEEMIFSFLSSRHNTKFYWDYDKYYTQNPKQEAGEFIKKNLKRFPMSQTFAIDDENIEKNDIKLKIISSPNASAQVGYITPWLENIVSNKENIEFKDIAIILCDEKLLPMVLNSIPEKINNKETIVNITMGYPIKETNIYSLIDSYLLLQENLLTNKALRLKTIIPFIENSYINKEYKDVLNNLIKENKVVLSKEDTSCFGNYTSLLEYKKDAFEIIDAIKELLNIVSSHYNSTRQRVNMENVAPEILYRIYNSLNTLYDIFNNEEYPLNIKGKLLYQTIRQTLSSIKIPFEGDPINGIQIMGLLESRNLDFKHILMLSANDDLLPSINMASSFIPHNIRKAYNITTINKKISVSAYYFYRLFQRASSIAFLYNSSLQEGNPNEISRFLNQVKLEMNKEIEYEDISFSINSPKIEEIIIPKTKKDIDEIIKKSNEKYISPTLINEYLNCKLRFYFNYILKLKEEEQYSEDLKDNDFGTIFHNAAKEFYDSIIKSNNGIREIRKEDIESQRKNIDYIVIRNFNKVYFHKEGEVKTENYNQKQRIKIEILKKYLKKLTNLDILYAPFTIVDMEKEVKTSIKIGDNTLNVGGIIDRIDLKNGVLRILDYKTNNRAKDEILYEDLFLAPKDKKRNDYYLQILIYCLLFEKENLKEKYDRIKPHILYIKPSSEKENIYDVSFDKQVVDDFSLISENFSLDLNKVLEEILNENSQFTQRISEDNCKYCPHKITCTL
ncbi:MAG: PD-(D/E)XK nuclease family protein [Bacteroidales bacterium]|jgi:AraC-like DNA-binding protein|nr:PD-(D/E)XK nuclease family protein [Bacteroidales bacterium]